MRAIWHKILGWITAFTTTIRDVIKLARDIYSALFGREQQRMKLRPWMIVRQSKKRAVKSGIEASDQDIRRLLERMNGLQDSELLADRAIAFSGEAGDYFGDPSLVRQFIENLVRQSPPFLHIARSAESAGSGRSNSPQLLYLERDLEVVERNPCTLFIPRVSQEYRESMRPPGYPQWRTARSLSDLRLAPMLYQTMPEELLFARYLEGSIPVLAFREERKTILFELQERIIERRNKKRIRVPVEVDSGDRADGARLIYLLIDRSASLVHNCAPRGINAVMELAIVATMLRSDMGRTDCAYFYRSFADRLDPLAKDPPWQAHTIDEMDDLVRRIMQTNFSGQATRVVDALNTAIDDIESMDPEQTLRPRIGLITDGRCTLYGSVMARLKRSGVKLDTILIGKDAEYNPDIARISDTVSFVDPAAYLQNN